MVVSENRVHDGCSAKSNVQQGLDIEVVSSQDDFEQHLLINGDKFLVPFANIGRSLSVLIRVGLIGSRQGLVTVVFAVFQNLRD